VDEYTKTQDELIHRIARKFYGVEREDLYQAGRLGLIKAYKNYKECEVPFEAYASKYIFGEMYDLSMKSRNIKLNKEYLKLYKLMNQTYAHLTQTLGREVTIEEISEYLGVPVHDLEMVKILMDEVFYLDDENECIQIGVEQNQDDHILFEESLESLNDPLSSAVIRYRYLYDLTQREVAELLGISQVNVSRIESKGKKKILEYISA